MVYPYEASVYARLCALGLFQLSSPTIFFFRRIGGGGDGEVCEWTAARWVPLIVCLQAIYARIAAQRHDAMLRK